MHKNDVPNDPIYQLQDNEKEHMEEGYATLRDDAETLRQAKIFWYKMRTCAWCGERFCLMDSFGAWECSYHPGFKVMRGERSVYNCCEKQESNAARGTAIQEVVNDYFGNESQTSMKVSLRKNKKLRNSVCPPVRRLPQPDGCVRADHRETREAWTEEDAADIQKFAALLPYLSELEEREGFKKATEEALVFRDSNSQKAYSKRISSGRSGEGTD